MRILLVDDDSGVIQALLPILKQHLGHEVRVGMDGQRAIDNAAGMGGVDLLITDVVMEPVDGFSLRDYLAAEHPGMKTIFISGYDLSDYAGQLQGDRVLEKPIDIEALCAAVEEALSPAGQAAGESDAPDVSDTPGASLAGDETPDSLAPAAATSGDGLIGQTLGAYQVVSFLGEGRLGFSYAAVQTSINRAVTLTVLDPERQQDNTLKSRFIGDARAKAHVQHPSILSVYEAGEAGGRIFFAREYVEGRSIADLQAGGAKIEEPMGLKVIRAVTEGLAYLHQNNIPHTPLDASSVYLGADGHPRLSNLAIQINESPQTVGAEIQALGRIMLSVLPAAQQLSDGLRALLGRMVQSPASGLNSFSLLLQSIKALEPKVVPVEAAKISAHDRAAVDAVEAARRQRRKSFWWSICSLTLLFGIVVFIVLKKFVFSNERRIQAMVEIPAGAYTLADGRTVSVPEPFWIDQYEVTWAEYNRFLQYLETHATADQDFRHSAMPRHFTHEPDDWKIYYPRARMSMPVHSTPIDLNCPVVDVRWWDAYACAAWLGRELPTADEWEVAASGGKGWKYPWGDEFDPARANTNTDYQPNDPAAKGSVDGYNFWNPVDEESGDKSPFGVFGMAGNVAEWTATWSDDKKSRVVKGGSFAQGDANLSTKILQDPSKPEEYIGFRTISRTNPKAAKSK